MASSYVRGGLDWILGNISSLKWCQALDQAAQRGGESSSQKVFKRQVDVALEDLV